MPFSACPYHGLKGRWHLSKIRVARVGEQMKKELADILQNHLKNQELGFITVTRVDMAGDLQHAKAYVSVFGDAAKKEEVLQSLQKAAGFVRGEIARRLHLRLAPEIIFKLDESGEYSAHIQTVLKSLEDSRPSSEAAGGQVSNNHLNQEFRTSEND